MSNLIQDTEKKTLRYWTEDGLPDLYIGLGFIIYGALTWWSARSGMGWVEMLKMIVMLALVFGGRFVLEKIKMYITYPRTGYVAYPRPPKSQLALRFLLGLFIAGGIVLIMTFVLSTQGEATGVALVSLLLPLLFGGIMAVIAHRQGSLRHGLYALVAVLSGLAAIPLAQGLPSADQSAVLNGTAMLFTTGAVMLIGGMFALLRYLNRHPKPQEGEA